MKATAWPPNLCERFADHVLRVEPLPVAKGETLASGMVAAEKAVDSSSDHVQQWTGASPAVDAMLATQSILLGEECKS